MQAPAPITPRVNPNQDHSKQNQSGAAVQHATPGETDNEHMHAELGSVAETGELQYQAALKKGATLVQAAQKLARMEGVPHANELDTTTVTVSSRYRHENQNSIYYLRPNSNEVYFLDFKLRGFC